MILLFALTLLLAFANGSNDISKGIATLVGSGVTNYRRAVIWGAVWTVAGGLVAAVASQALVKTFSGGGLLTSTPQGHGFLIAVACGAVGWILFASWSGLPVSTTHAITGALCGAGIVAVGFDGVRWAVLGTKVALPLAASPIISLALMWALFPVVRFCFSPLNRYCVCVEKQDVVAQPESDTAAMTTAMPTVIAGETRDCVASPTVVSRLKLMDSLHWLTAGATSFARGLNDTPKILALGVAASALAGISGSTFYVFVAFAMGAGCLIAGLRVTKTLAERVTPMNPSEGFAANLVTSLLVGVASRFGMPVSTTHVSSSAIIGIGLHHGAHTVRWKVVGEMLLAWLVTLPTAALIAAAICGLIK